METQDAYNNWAGTYDSVHNKTRDLEARAIKAVLENRRYEKVLEIGCGTGKNTGWLANKCSHLTAIDFSEEMLHLARQKITSEKVTFQWADINQPWGFRNVNLITCSLVLEHIRDIQPVFKEAASALEQGGQFYICELHPFKQLQGSRARFERDGTLLQLEYFIHQISDYWHASKQHGFCCDNLQEWFDNEDRNQVPRLISFMFRRL